MSRYRLNSRHLKVYEMNRKTTTALATFCHLVPYVIDHFVTIELSLTDIEIAARRCSTSENSAS